MFFPPLDGLVGKNTRSFLDLPSQILSHSYFLYVSGKFPCSSFVYVKSKVTDALEVSSMCTTKKDREKREMKEKRGRENGEERAYIKGTKISLEKQ